MGYFTRNGSPRQQAMYASVFISTETNIFLTHSSFSDDISKVPPVSSKDKDKEPPKLTVAVCVNIKMKAQSKDNIEFALVWNMPHISFNGEKDKIVKR